MLQRKATTTMLTVDDNNKQRTDRQIGMYIKCSRTNIVMNDERCWKVKKDLTNCWFHWFIRSNENSLTQQSAHLKWYFHSHQFTQLTDRHVCVREMGSERWQRAYVSGMLIKKNAKREQNLCWVNVSEIFHIDFEVDATLCYAYYPFSFSLRLSRSLFRIRKLHCFSMPSSSLSKLTNHSTIGGRIRFVWFCRMNDNKCKRLHYERNDEKYQNATERELIAVDLISLMRGREKAHTAHHSIDSFTLDATCASAVHNQFSWNFPAVVHTQYTHSYIAAILFTNDCFLLCPVFGFVLDAEWTTNGRRLHTPTHSPNTEIHWSTENPFCNEIIIINAIEMGCVGSPIFHGKPHQMDINLVQMVHLMQR